jgi:hypothetical protein
VVLKNSFDGDNTAETVAQQVNVFTKIKCVHEVVDVLTETFQAVAVGVIRTFRETLSSLGKGDDFIATLREGLQ